MTKSKTALLLNETDIRETCEVIVENVNGVKSAYIKGIFQEAGIKNQNGRIYPENILFPEIQRYANKYVGAGRAIGELDHPQCYSGDAEILTIHGWKLIKDISEDENIYTLNPDTKKVEVQKINKKVAERYTGKMIKIESLMIDSLVTPTHRFLFFNEDKGIFKTAEELKSNQDNNVFQVKYDNLATLSQTDNPLSANIKEYAFNLNFASIEEVDFDDFVYCVNVTNETFYVRQNNKAYWTGNSPTINLDRVSHKIVDLTIEGSKVIGKALIGGPKGDVVRKILEMGVQLGVSSRSLGNLDMNNRVSELQLITWDIVHEPSVSSALMEQVTEGLRFEWLPDNQSFTSQYKTLEERFTKTKKDNGLSKKEKQVVFATMFEEFLRNL